MTNVGWIGLGAMGFPMAGVVARAGHPVTAFDIDQSKAAYLAGDGVTAAATCADAAKDAEVLVCMVATPAQVESVLFGDNGAAPALKAGSVVMVMATVGPAPIEAWASKLAEQGVEVVDAPVSGGTARAATGDLLVMVSGSADAVAKAQPLLDAMANNAPVVGDKPGDGQKVKLVNQLLCGAHIAVAAEALAFAEAMGLDAAATWETIRNGAAASFMFGDRGERMVHPTDETKSAIDIFVKDMGLVTDAARALYYPTPIASAAQAAYLAAHRAGLGRTDDSNVIQVMRGKATAQ